MALAKSGEAKKVNLDFNKEFINTFTQNIENRNVEFINQTLKDLHEADVASRNQIELMNKHFNGKSYVKDGIESDFRLDFGVGFWYCMYNFDKEKVK